MSKNNDVDPIADKRLKEIIDKYIETEKENELIQKEFVDSKSYIKLFHKTIRTFDEVKTYIDNQTDEWTKEIDMMFDLIYDNAYILLALNEKEDYYRDVIVKVNDDLIKFSKFHGQGCYCSISKYVNEGEVVSTLVNLIDIIHFIETGNKPTRTHVLELVYTLFNSFDAVNKNFGLNIDIEAAIDYIEDNLK